MSQERRRPSSFLETTKMGRTTTTPSSSLFIPPSLHYLLLLPPRAAATSSIGDIAHLRQAQNVTTLIPASSFAKMSEESITTSSFNPVSSRDIAVMEDTPLRFPTFEQHMPIINGMPVTPRHDAFSQFTEKDFDDGFNKFFHNRVKPINPLHQPFEDSTAFVACSPFDSQHQYYSTTAELAIKNHRTRIHMTSTLLQHMDTSEKSRRKVAKIRSHLRHKLIQNHQHQLSKEFVAGTRSKAERTIQSLLCAQNMSPRNSKTPLDL